MFPFCRMWLNVMLPRVGKRDAVRPGAAVVFGQKNGPVRETERLVIALRVNVRTRRLQAIPEVIRRRKVGLSSGGVGADPMRAAAHNPAGGSRRGTQKPAASHSLLWRDHAMPRAVTGFDPTPHTRRGSRPRKRHLLE